MMRRLQLADIEKEAQRVEGQVKDTFNNADVKTRNRVILGVVVGVIVVALYFFLKH